MIEGVRLLSEGITSEGDSLDPHRIVLAVEKGHGDEPTVEVTLEDGSTWSVDLEAVERALVFAKTEFRKSRV